MKLIPPLIRSNQLHLNSTSSILQAREVYQVGGMDEKLKLGCVHERYRTVSQFNDLLMQLVQAKQKTVHRWGLHWMVDNGLTYIIEYFTLNYPAQPGILLVYYNILSKNKRIVGIYTIKYFVCLFVCARPEPQYLELRGETWHDCTLRLGEGVDLDREFGDPLYTPYKSNNFILYLHNNYIEEYISNLRKYQFIVCMCVEKFY